ncbi:MAG: Uncharacterised protein [Cryomorphaceae bacterium]|nr:MAG: Uncharacterised protein [Cryomorphaceae bacterium]
MGICFVNGFHRTSVLFGQFKQRIPLNNNVFHLTLRIGPEGHAQKSDGDDYAFYSHSIVAGGLELIS